MGVIYYRFQFLDIIINIPASFRESFITKNGEKYIEKKTEREKMTRKNIIMTEIKATIIK